MTKLHPIRKILIANRGEIACRVIRTCKRLGIATVAVYSDSDRDALHTKLADEAVHIGPSASSDSYLCGDKIVLAALRTNTEAIHPGYGFLSENAAFAQSCIDAGLIFIGPTPDSIRAIGDKIGAKRLLRDYDTTIPLIPGYNDADQTSQRLVSEALRVGFPVLIKASAGGGGKGMRVVHEEAELQQAIETAKSEGERSFGSGELLIERYFDGCRHVEIQIFGDRWGNVVHVFERDCSVQRRHQKVIEETPSPIMTPSLRAEMVSAAIKIGQAIKYQGAGTVEFIVDRATSKFYFLEVNTRLQVEHPITEAITGLDLVELQIKIASGMDLRTLGEIDSRGCAVECRVYAEDPEKGFLPATGKIRMWKEVEGVRYDGGITTGSNVTIHYDPLLAKVIAYAPTRAQALQRLSLALRQTAILGPTTNIPFLLRTLNHPVFMSGDYGTDFISSHQDELFPPIDGSLLPTETHLIPWLYSWYLRETKRTILRHLPSGWSNVKGKDNVQKDSWLDGKRAFEISYEFLGGGAVGGVYRFQISVGWEGTNERREMEVVITEVNVWSDENNESYGNICCSIDGIQRAYNVATEITPTDETVVYVHNSDLGGQSKFTRVDRLRIRTGPSDGEDDFSPYEAPMPCRILRILTPSGSKVKKNDALLTMESMKTEVRLHARKDGVVQLRVVEGELVEAGTLLCEIK